MDELKNNLLLDLADYTATIDLALQGRDLDVDDRLWYLGHLATCGRIFKSVYLDDPVESLEQIYRIESASFKIGARNDERGAIARDAWGLFSSALESYMATNKRAGHNSVVRLSDDIQKFAAAVIQSAADMPLQTNNIPNKKLPFIRDFAQSLIVNAYSAVNAKHEFDRITETHMLDLFWHYLYFWLHLTDRSAYSTLADPLRHSLMDELGHFTVTLALDVLCPDQKDALLERAMAGLNLAVAEYSQFPRIVPNANEDRKGTLVWEFSKTINRLLGSETNLGAIVGEEAALYVGAKQLDIESFLANVAKDHAYGGA